MKLLDQILESGWGATFLFIYSAGILYFGPFDLSYAELILAAIIPSLVLVFLSVSFNDELFDLLAEDAIRESYLEIKEKTGEDEFYWDSDREVQEQIDDLDNRAHRSAVTILAGGLIAVSLPFTTYWIFGLLPVIASSVGSLIIVYLLCIRQYRYLHEVVKSSVKLYESNDEN